jgi:hypothetical protein
MAVPRGRRRASERRRYSARGASTAPRRKSSPNWQAGTGDPAGDEGVGRDAGMSPDSSAARAVVHNKRAPGDRRTAGGVRAGRPHRSRRSAALHAVLQRADGHLLAVRVARRRARPCRGSDAVIGRELACGRRGGRAIPPALPRSRQRTGPTGCARGRCRGRRPARRCPRPGSSA